MLTCIIKRYAPIRVVKTDKASYSNQTLRKSGFWRFKSFPRPHFMVGVAEPVDAPGQVNTSLHIFKEYYMDLYETDVGVDIGESDISIYVDGQKVLQIDQVSDNKVINLFLTPVGTARFMDQGACCNLIFNGNTKDTTTLELLADRKQKQI